MIVVLTGAPGAGKGTQAELLAGRCGYQKLSTGDALRHHVKIGSDIGKIAGAIMERGELVPDDVLFKVLSAELNRFKGQVVLLDGYPRNVAQAETLESLKAEHPVKAAIQLNVPREELIKRLSGRRVCGQCGATYHVDSNPAKAGAVCDKCGGQVAQRADDRPESVAVRLDVYEKNTRPVLDFYKKKGLEREVEGLGSAEAIYQQIKAVIDSL